MGLVGINESGKTNVLLALKCLSSEESLRKSDSPRVGHEASPSIRFEFSLNDTDREKVASALQQMCADSKIDVHSIVAGISTVEYCVSLSAEGEASTSRFKLGAINIGKLHVLKPWSETQGWHILIDGSNRVPTDCVLLTQDAIDVARNDEQASATAQELRSQEAELLKETASSREEIERIVELAKDKEEGTEADGESEEEDAPTSTAKLDTADAAQISHLEKEIEGLERSREAISLQRQELENQIVGIDRFRRLDHHTDVILRCQEQSEYYQRQIDALTKKIDAIDDSKALTSDQEAAHKKDKSNCLLQMTSYVRSLRSMQTRIGLKMHSLNHLLTSTPTTPRWLPMPLV